MIVNRTRSALDGGVGGEVKVVLGWVGNVPLHDSTGLDVSIAVGGVTVLGVGEEPVVVAFAANGHCDSWLQRLAQVAV